MMDVGVGMGIDAGVETGVMNFVFLYDTVVVKRYLSRSYGMGLCIDEGLSLDCVCFGKQIEVYIFIQVSVFDSSINYYCSEFIV